MSTCTVFMMIWYYETCNFEPLRSKRNRCDVYVPVLCSQMSIGRYQYGQLVVCMYTSIYHCLAVNWINLVQKHCYVSEILLLFVISVIKKLLSSVLKILRKQTVINERHVFYILFTLFNPCVLKTLYLNFNKNPFFEMPALVEGSF